MPRSQVPALVFLPVLFFLLALSVLVRKQKQREGPWTFSDQNPRLKKGKLETVGLPVNKLMEKN